MRLEIFAFLICGLAYVNAQTDYPHGISNVTTNYPEKQILAAISRDSSFDTMFGDVFRPETNIYDRFGSGSGANICPSRQITYQPRAGRSVSNAIKKIVNVDGYAQFVTVEVCEDNARSSIDCLMPAGYTFRCKTQHVTIRLVVYNENGSLAVENFSIPSGCACTYDFV